MDKILIPESSFKDLCELLAKLMGKEKGDTEDNYVSYNNSYSFWYNRTWLNSNANENLNNVVEEILNNQSLSSPTLITYTKDNMNNELEQILRDNNYANIACQIGMIKELKDYTPYRENSCIVRIDKTRVEEWSDVVTKSFGKAPELDAYKVLIQNNECYLYGYFQDDKIIGTAMLYANPDNAGIHEVGTLHEYRRSGIANAMVYKLLNVAKELNIPIASLQASEAGEKVYSTMGFEKVSVIPTWVKKG